MFSVSVQLQLLDQRGKGSVDSPFGTLPPININNLKGQRSSRTPLPGSRLIGERVVCELPFGGLIQQALARRQLCCQPWQQISCPCCSFQVGKCLGSMMLGPGQHGSWSLVPGCRQGHQRQTLTSKPEGGKTLRRAMRFIGFLFGPCRNTHTHSKTTSPQIKLELPHLHCDPVRLWLALTCILCFVCLELLSWLECQGRGRARFHMLQGPERELQRATEWQWAKRRCTGFFG